MSSLLWCLLNQWLPEFYEEESRNLSRRQFAMERVSILNIDEKRIPEECSPEVNSPYPDIRQIYTPDLTKWNCRIDMEKLTNPAWTCLLAARVVMKFLQPPVCGFKYINLCLYLLVWGI